MIISVKYHDHSTKNFILDKTFTVIGSGVTCNLRIDAPGVSRRHLKLTKLQNKLYAEDLGSTNGSFIDNIKLEPGSPIEILDSSLIVVGTLVEIKILEDSISTLDLVIPLSVKKNQNRNLTKKLYLHSVPQKNTSVYLLMIVVLVVVIYTTLSGH